MTVAPARAQFRHDVPYGLAGIVRGLAEQEGRALPDPVGEGIEHDRQVFLIRLGSGVVKELARQIKPRMGPDAADDADPFILSHGCLRFPAAEGNFPRRSPPGKVSGRVIRPQRAVRRVRGRNRFPALKQTGARGVAKHVDGGTGHVHDAVDAGDESDGFQRDAHLREDHRDHDEGRAGHAHGADGGEDGEQDDGELPIERAWGCRRPRRRRWRRCPCRWPRRPC